MKILEFRDVAVAAMTEHQLQAQVIGLATFHGFRLIYHTHDSRRSNPGFPDLVLVSTRQKRILYRELKREKGRVTPAQQEWIDALTGTGQDACVWRPRDLFEGRIEASLKGAPA